jgi:hypothetical protein
MAANSKQPNSQVIFDVVASALRLWLMLGWPWRQWQKSLPSLTLKRLYQTMDMMRAFGQRWLPTPLLTLLLTPPLRMGGGNVFLKLVFCGQMKIRFQPQRQRSVRVALP